MLKPYTVHYRDFQNIRLENCFYAFDAYEARTLAMEFNKYVFCCYQNILTINMYLKSLYQGEKLLIQFFFFLLPRFLPSIKKTNLDNI